MDNTALENINLSKISLDDTSQMDMHPEVGGVG